MAGALLDAECRDLLEQVGFVEIDLKKLRIYELETPQGRSLLPGISDLARGQYAGAITSTFISATKP